MSVYDREAEKYNGSMSFDATEIDAKLTQVISTISTDSLIADIGTPQRFAKELSSFQDQLALHRYYALGYHAETKFGRNNCDVDGDALHLPFKTASVDLALSLEVIEHVLDPQRAIDELERILKPHGIIFLTTPFLMPYHGKSSSRNDFSHQTYPDFWRFTYQGLQVLFEGFDQVEVIPFTNTYRYLANRVAHLNQLPGLRQGWFQRWLAGLQKPYLGVATHRHAVIAHKKANR